MARLQVLFLPPEHVGEQSSTPYILILDQLAEDELEAMTGLPVDSGGARAVWAFPFTVEVF